MYSPQGGLWCILSTFLYIGGDFLTFVVSVGNVVGPLEEQKTG